MSSFKLQIAFDLTDGEKALKIAEQVAEYADILEIGTPLLKSEGKKIIEIFRKNFPSAKILADTKTMDVGTAEAELVFSAGADIMTVCAAAPLETVKAAIEKAVELGKEVMIDFIGVNQPLEVAEELARLNPHYFLLHRAIDEREKERNYPLLQEFTRRFPVPLAIAGSITAEELPRLLPLKPSIIVVGSYIVNSPDPPSRAKSFKLGSVKSGSDLHF